MKTIPTEHDEQVTFCQWLDIVGVTYYAVQNENIWSGVIRAMLGKIKALKIISAVERKLRVAGKKKGMTDMVCLFEGGVSVYIEMKRRKGSSTSTEQKEWQQRLKLLGFEAHICKGAAEAIAVIEKHLPQNKRGLNAKQAVFDV